MKKELQTKGEKSLEDISIYDSSSAGLLSDLDYEGKKKNGIRKPKAKSSWV